jgi:iron-sulfur cluster assembly accessory protein
MKRLFSTSPKFPINISKSAWDKMKEIISIQSAESFLFSATSGGCNGFNYNLRLLNKEKYNNYFMNNHKIKPTKIENGDIKILIDPMTEMLLLGTTIDYVSENFEKGIFENKFIFTADKTVASSCGCGISFNPK